MNKYDYLGLDGKSLKILVTVLEESSVSAAAKRLDMSQPAVSHALDRLRDVLGDPLFVKSGRGIRPTVHARALGEQARRILAEMKALTTPAEFKPGDKPVSFTIAANDYQRDLLLPCLLERLRRQASNVHVAVVPSGIPSAEQLRDDGCDLVITPHPPQASDIVQKRILTDDFMCFYDPAVRTAPKTLSEYLAADHVSVRFGNGERVILDDELEQSGIRRRVTLTVPNFSGALPLSGGAI
ncbi:LysR family transcriptional regulator [Alkalilimnicola ehrlichii]|uniref:LysR family transcriptional regulator n=1 Tax=Alkalilimnicola ehrlichii TaxID=351052 RepID=UPI001C6E721A|nr:LysR family transcriptional regulator [Alkalilimnicola ehrlichii]